MTNFELLLERMTPGYLTPEKISYMEEHYKDRINEVDISQGALDTWVVNIKNELNKVYPIEYKVEEPEPTKKSIDWFEEYL